MVAYKTAELLDIINNRFDGVERLLRLMLVNELLDEAEQVVKVVDEPLDSKLSVILGKYGVNFGGFKSIHDIEILIIDIPEGVKVKSKEIASMYSEISELYLDKEPLFMFDIINGMQKKRIMQEGISFGVKGKELHITCRGSKK